MVFPSIQRIFFFHAHLLFTGLTDVLSRLEQRPSRAVPRLVDTSDTGGDESDMAEPRRSIRSKKNYQMKKAWKTSDVGHFFDEPTDVKTKPSLFFCHICCKDVSVVTHGHHKI